jgi:hypothetical protein
MHGCRLYGNGAGLNLKVCPLPDVTANRGGLSRVAPGGRSSWFRHSGLLSGPVPKGCRSLGILAQQLLVFHHCFFSHYTAAGGQNRTE